MPRKNPQVVKYPDKMMCFNCEVMQTFVLDGQAYLRCDVCNNSYSEAMVHNLVRDMQKIRTFNTYGH